MTNSASVFKSTLARLKEKTKDCNIQMHEPDNENIYAIVTGTHLDNAMGDNPCKNCLEYTVGLGDESGNNREWFNLADLIALARLAKI